MLRLECGASALIAADRFAEALIAGQAAVATEPLRESTRRLVVQAHLARGNVAEALRQFHQYRSLLRTEFAIEPSPAMARLVRPLLGAMTAG